jgi:hypothetical protein
MRKILIATLIVLALVISACSGGGNQQDNTKTYIGGSQGLKIKFATGAPPVQVSDIGGDESFDIIVEIENKGEEPVLASDAYISIKGFPPEAFGKSVGDVTDVAPDENIDARIKTADATIIEPPMIYTTIEGLKYQYAEPGNVQYPVRAEICYLYETSIASKLCIKEDMTQNDDGDICDVSGMRDISSSGAPVQVTKIQQSGAGKDKTRFTFTIANQDTGLVFKKGNGCQTTNAYENKVYVQIENLLDRGADSVSCVGLSGGNSDSEGYVTLTEGQSRDVSCTVTMVERSDRLQPFNIRLSYDYMEYVDTNILIEYTPDE